MAKTIITDEQIDPESPVTSELMTALRDNAGADIQTFTASGTWTKPDSTALVFVYLWGGGGGGASRSTNETSSQGGAGGGFVMHTFNEIDLASSVSVTIGAGGAAGVGFDGGSAGGDTTFAGMSAGGGAGGDRGTGSSLGAEPGGAFIGVSGELGGDAKAIDTAGATSNADNTFASGAAGGNIELEGVDTAFLGGSSTYGGDGGDGSLAGVGGAGGVRGGGGGASGAGNGFGGDGGDGFAVIISI